MPNLYLTDTFVENVFCPPDKDQELFWDHPKTLEGQIRKGAVEGLGLRVTINGKKSFIHTFKLNGKRRRVMIGKPANMNVKAARIKVTMRQNDVLAETDPDAGTKQAFEENVLTVQEAIEEYWKRHLAETGKPHRYDFTRYVAPWLWERKTGTKRGKNHSASDIRFGEMYKTMLLHKVKPVDVQNCLSQYKTPSTYNGALKNISALFNWAIRMQLIDVRNPCTPFRSKKVIKQRRDYDLQQIKTITRHIYQPTLRPIPELTGEGVERQKQALANGKLAASNTALQEYCRFMGILFLTTARPKEVMNAEFEHFDLNRLIWHKHNTKGIKLSRQTYEYAYRSVPVHQMVCYLVQEQKALWPDSDYLFPSPKDRSQPRTEFKRALAQFKKLEGVPSYFQIYDLKRMALSLMLHNAQLDQKMVSHYTDHKGDVEMTKIYDLGLTEVMRPVANQIGEMLEVNTLPATRILSDV